MAVLAVADHVDDDVFVELLAEFEGQLSHPEARLGVVAVHMEDRCLHHLRHVGAVHRAARRFGVCREADLVVDDQVDSPSGAVAAQLAEVQRLGDHALPDERGIAVHQEGQHRELVGRVDLVLLGPHDALDDGIDGLEMARVRGQRHRYRVARDARVLPVRAEVVLHVTAAIDGPERHVLELAEHLVHALAHDVHERVEPTPVGHADHGLGHPVGAGAIEHRVKHDHGRLAAFEAKALLPRVALVEELLERLGLVQHEQDVALLVNVERGVDAFNMVLDPLLLYRIHDVHVFDADGTAIGVTQDSQQ